MTIRFFSRVFACVLVCATSLISVTSHSAIIDLGTITRDTATGLDWLDVTETRGLAAYEVLLETETGGAYEGWRYAIIAELDQLIINFGYVAANSPCPQPNLHCDDIIGDYPIVENMIHLLGDTDDAWLDEINHMYDVSEGGAGATIGVLSTSSDPDDYNTYGGQWGMAGIYDSDLVDRITREPSGYPDGVAVLSFSHSLPSQYSSSPVYGSFLVRVAPVPLPATAWLFLSAVGGLVGIKRKFQ